MSFVKWRSFFSQPQCLDLVVVWCLTLQNVRNINLWLLLPWDTFRYKHNAFPVKCFHCLTLTIPWGPEKVLVDWCGSNKIFRSNLKLCSSSKDALFVFIIIIIITIMIMIMIIIVIIIIIIIIVIIIIIIIISLSLSKSLSFSLLSLPLSLLLSLPLSLSLLLLLSPSLLSSSSLLLLSLLLLLLSTLVYDRTVILSLGTNN